MKANSTSKVLVVALACLVARGVAAQVAAQEAASVPAMTVSSVPRLVNFSGVVKSQSGRPVAGLQGVTFLIYKDQEGGAPLWLETQSVQFDAADHYTVQLGSASAQGLPPEIFTGGEGRWLGVQVGSEPEQPRVLFVAVPYALKSADAETIGGLPPSAFVLNRAYADGSLSNHPTSGSAALAPASITGSGATNYVPLWTSSSGLGNSVMFQTGSGSSAKIGLNTTTPTAMLDVKGSVTIRSLLNLPATTNATASAGADSNQIGFVASAYNSGTKAATNQVFRWLAEPTGNNTASPAATLNLLFGVPPSTPAETGLKINSKGIITFASGQTFPGSGRVTSVGLSAPSSDFTVTGSPVTTSGTLNLAWNVAPTSDDTFNSIVKRDSTGSFSAGSVTANLGVSGFSPSVGVYGESDGSVSGNNGVQGTTLAGPGSGVAGFNASGGIGVYGQGGTGVYGRGTNFGFATDSNVQQARGAGGWVKAMVYLNGLNAPYKIVECFNSALSGAAASTPPCGLNLEEVAPGEFTIDFGFEIDDRFFLGTLNAWSSGGAVVLQIQPDTANVLFIDCTSGGGNYAPFSAYIFVF